MRHLLFASCLLLAVASATPQQSTKDTRVYRVGLDDVKPPQSISTPLPELPANAAKEETAILSAIVDINGDVHNVKVVRSTGHSNLDNKAVEKLAAWKLRPCTHKGQPVNCAMNLEITFHLNRDHK